MNDEREQNHEPVSSNLSTGAQVDQICDRFEDALRAGEEPSIESYLCEAPDGFRSAALWELLLLDLEYRQRRGQLPVVDDYRERFPDDIGLIERALQESDESKTLQNPLKTEVHIPGDGSGDESSLSAVSKFSDLKFVDQGGLGQVYRADDNDLRRPVAIKFIHDHLLWNREAVERFHVEAEVTGRLDHPAIVPVYSTGQNQKGRPFYVMRYIEGENFRAVVERLHEKRSELDRAGFRHELIRLLTHMIAACNAVAYAHNRGVLHRDFKPENIMLGKYGETLLVDWGLAQFVQRTDQARESGEETLMPGVPTGGVPKQGSSTSGGGAGTIGYISPEQLPDSIETIGPASDIYSIGATLYKVLTGSAPFHSQQGKQVWSLIRKGDFPPPRRINPDVPRALEAICLKAMALRPADRYANVLEFAADLNRWIADEPVSVFRQSLFERSIRWARRHPGYSAATLVAVGLILIGTIVTTAVFNHQASSERALRSEAVMAQEDAQAARQVTEEARRAHLRSVAIFAADMFGYEIDQRWRILSEAAVEPELASLLEAIAASPEDEKLRARLQNWLNRVSGDSIETGKSLSWFVMDAEGTQLARNPGKGTIGRNYAHRSYFHGADRDLSSDEVKENRPVPIDSENVSAVYESSMTHEWKVAFSVPVFGEKAVFVEKPSGRLKVFDRLKNGKALSGEKTVIGVLAMSVRLGGFIPLDADSNHMKVALVDLRPDWIGGNENSGLIIDHPDLLEARTRLSDSDSVAQIRLGQESVEKLRKLQKVVRQRRQLHGGVSPGRSSLPDAIDRAYRDPTEAGESTCIAAFEPVFVPGRSEGQDDIGWMIIIQDLSEQP
jgi:eukaryotic-like serine/threonine-protein kinase